jgi:hypothetical protein
LEHSTRRPGSRVEWPRVRHGRHRLHLSEDVHQTGSSPIVSQTFGIDVDKNVVYRALSKHYRPAPSGSGPSWLSFIGHTTDSLWSVDLFRCESILLRSYWVLVVMDQFTRRLVGIGVHGGAVTGADVCPHV